MAYAQPDTAGPGSAAASSPMRPVAWLALGTFAIGTESFMIAPLLPDMAADLSVSAGAVGQLVTVFTLVYALSSPVLTVLAGGMERRRMLACSMALFCAGNVVAALSSHYLGLLGARVLLALAAGLYAPNANALAGSIVPPALRGRALAIVNGGSTIAIALGVPAGALLGHQLGRRWTFVAVAVMAAVAVLGVRFGLPAHSGGTAPAAGVRDRLSVLARPGIAPALFVTFFWAMGAYTVYTYLAPITVATTDMPASWVPGLVLLWGVAAGIGLILGGFGNDRLGAPAVVLPSLGVLAAAFLAVSALGWLVQPGWARLPLVAAVVFWGVSVWSFFPAQLARLTEAAGPQAAAVALSLNASFMFLGFSAGAAFGGFVLGHAGATSIGFAGMAAELVALAIATLALHRRSGA